jgi:hypothetical protein
MQKWSPCSESIMIWTVTAKVLLVGNIVVFHLGDTLSVVVDLLIRQ